MRLSKPSIETGRQFSLSRNGILFELGNVYSYMYSPINKDKLMFYDPNPLVLFLEYHPRTNCIFGVNLHFLPIGDREFLIEKIKDEKNNISSFLKWDLLYNERIFQSMAIGFRKYKVTHITSPTKIFDIDLDEDIDRGDLKISRRIRSETGFSYNQTIARKLTSLSKGNKDWKQFLRTINRNK